MGTFVSGVIVDVTADSDRNKRGAALWKGNEFDKVGEGAAGDRQPQVRQPVRRSEASRARLPKRKAHLHPTFASVEQQVRSPMLESWKLRLIQGTLLKRRNVELDVGVGLTVTETVAAAPSGIAGSSGHFVGVDLRGKWGSPESRPRLAPPSSEFRQAVWAASRASEE
ncbi:uncharacterized protein THITE_2089061 [Thermothielavioides terrestris NRRL 8126]|uniref:Uncharacterized protein n=1 Tax=Thermothielavioides terrestris (strain ATCC 38088 / NRRL 8126) TaxID=578455 RepID=G2R634_THETT|nr:uncharacterized protein THITE_2089061 [Thermothielavioides terrestris NRRL 8126]AEO67571.1 hypothetical protein THITE_2089061 [Thermothielavioides terrestris NRRL 8126]